MRHVRKRTTITEKDSIMADWITKKQKFITKKEKEVEEPT